MKVIIKDELKYNTGLMYRISLSETDMTASFLKHIYVTLAEIMNLNETTFTLSSISKAKVQTNILHTLLPLWSHQQNCFPVLS